MQYVVRHLTRFVYSSPVCESLMELRMHPLEHDRQRPLRFSVTTNHPARVFAYHDHYGNAVHYFNVPRQHTKLEVRVESTVGVAAAPDPPHALLLETWSEIDALAGRDGLLEWLLPSPFAAPTQALSEFAASIGLTRSRDPLSTLHWLNAALFETLAYAPRTTHVDSPIDDALRLRAGVCQDFSHIMTALVRGLGIPCRYVSGYLAHDETHHDRGDNATHAWVEAFVPRLGWVGFDPTNKTTTGARHIAVAIGRDYSDVPPTRGVFKGNAGSEMSIAVAVTPSTSPLASRDLTPNVSWIAPASSLSHSQQDAYLQQQQQQQQ